MKKLFWAFSILCSLFGAFAGYAGLMKANGAPQEAAAAAIAMAFAVIPYCLARAISEISSDKKITENK